MTPFNVFVETKRWLILVVMYAFLQGTSCEHLTTEKILMVLILIAVLLLFLSEAYDLHRDAFLPWCDFSSNYTIPGPFKANLDKLLSNLPDAAANSNSLFFNNSFGTAPAVAYGLAQCRTDMSAYDCGICLYRSALRALSQCLLYRSATILSNICTLRYSDRHFFSEVSLNFVTVQDFNNVSNPTAFSKPLRKLMHEVLSKAPMSATKFASAYFNDSIIGSIYGTAGCSRDLTDAGCSTCLNQALPHVLEVGYSKGYRVFSVTCQVRFEIYPILARPPPTLTRGYPSEVTMNQGMAGNRNDATKTVLAVVLSLTVAIGLVSVIYLCSQKRRKIRKLIFLRDLQYDETDFASAESKWFELSILRDATDNFSNQNKLGQGGFGSVYKVKRYVIFY
ncbi:Protein kinase-like (PK-like) protein [Dioscorea alata]|uniref:Protein kinase-like (PK-like) protein n=1 Tax=Dioscorea alata TaxID=55571 RepID=A0ACB7UPA7_DIOAL|nr:Protein kinase-like (PK-like) protein [Dioscorea alata]